MTLLRQVILKFGLLGIPFAAVYLLFFVVAWRSGEAMPVALVVQRQIDDPTVLYNPVRREKIMPYKIYTANMRDPNILVMGSSRSLQLRREMFNRRPDAFYNLGSFDWRFDRTVDALDLLNEDTHLDLLILELDLPWFLENYHVEDNQIVILSRDGQASVSELFESTNATIRPLLKNPTLFVDYWNPVSPTFNQPILGLEVIRSNSGFRADGSIQHGRLIRGTADLEGSHAADRERLANRTEEFSVGSTLKPAYFEELNEVFAYARAHNTTVVAFTAPFAPYVWDVVGTQAAYAYLYDLSQRLDTLFANNGFVYFDFMNPYDLGLSLEDFNDGWHSSETAYVKMLIDMAQARPDIFDPYVDVPQLRSALDQAESTWMVFPFTGQGGSDERS